MKQLLLTVLSFLLAYNLSAQNLKALDDKNGFREDKFGMDISEFENMVLEIGIAPQFDMYHKSNENLTIGDYKLKEIKYLFYKDKFFSVTIKTDGYGSSIGMLKTLKELYGKGVKPNKYIEKYEWVGSKVSASYTLESNRLDATIMIFNIEIRDQLKQGQKDGVKKAKDDM